MTIQTAFGPVNLNETTGASSQNWNYALRGPMLAQAPKVKVYLKGPASGALNLYDGIYWGLEAPGVPLNFGAPPTELKINGQRIVSLGASEVACDLIDLVPVQDAVNFLAGYSSVSGSKYLRNFTFSGSEARWKPGQGDGATVEKTGYTTGDTSACLTITRIEVGTEADFGGSNPEEPPPPANNYDWPPITEDIARMEEVLLGEWHSSSRTVEGQPGLKTWCRLGNPSATKWCRLKKAVITVEQDTEIEFRSSPVAPGGGTPFGANSCNLKWGGPNSSMARSVGNSASPNGTGGLHDGFKLKAGVPWTFDDRDITFRDGGVIVVVLTPGVGAKFKVEWREWF